MNVLSVVSLSEFKQFAGIDHSSEDSMLAGVLLGAEQYIAKICGTYISLEVGSFIEVYDGGFQQIWATQKPIVSVSEVYDKYAEEICSEDDYENDDRCIYIVDGGYWAEGDRRYRVTYTAGWTRSTIPPPVHTGIMMLAARHWENKGTGGYGDSPSGLMQDDILSLVSGHSMRRVVN